MGPRMGGAYAQPGAISNQTFASAATRPQGSDGRGGIGGAGVGGSGWEGLGGRGGDFGLSGVWGGTPTA